MYDIFLEMPPYLSLHPVLLFFIYSSNAVFIIKQFVTYFGVFSAGLKLWLLLNPKDLASIPLWLFSKENNIVNFHNSYSAPQMFAIVGVNWIFLKNIIHGSDHYAVLKIAAL